MEMEGGDYVTLDTGLPDELTELTVSAWVTPDFDSGSKIMTIVSQDQTQGMHRQQGLRHASL